VFSALKKSPCGCFEETKSMKKVIGGRLYNTETATLIAEYDSGSCGMQSFEEGLYLSPRLRFFLAGSGGAMSPWRESVSQNLWGPGEGMRVLTDSEARDWCEQRGIDADVIEKHFPIEEG
jgi:hypothetical protein